jgi:endonuclease YncB( thermonuclease family)
MAVLLIEHHDSTMPVLHGCYGPLKQRYFFGSKLPAVRRVLLCFVLLSQSVQAETLSGTVIGIVDGDRLTVEDAQKRKHRVRLAEIDAPQRKQAFGDKSRQSLSALCLKKPAKVEWQAKDKNDRYVAQVTCNGVDANAEQVRAGMAWVSPASTRPGSPLYELEAYARIRGIGLWADPSPVPPWEWDPKSKSATK